MKRKPMSTGFEKIGSDRHLQDHWLRRLIAFLIDSLLIGVAAVVFTALISLFKYHSDFFLLSFISGVFCMFYSAAMESLYGWTVGKKVMNLKTATVDGKLPTFDSALIRDVSKIFFIFVLLDVVIGLATPGDPHQKITDRIAKTTVIAVTPQMPGATTAGTTVVVQPPPATP